MDANPVDVAKILMAIPTTLQTVKNLLPQTKDENVKKKLEVEVETLRKTIIEYAKMHYSLEEWKNLHDYLQMVDSGNKKLEAEVMERDLNKIDWVCVESTWRGLRQNQLLRLEGFGQGVKHIGLELSLPSFTEPARKANWVEEFRDKASRIQREIDAKNSPDRLRESVDEFIFLTQRTLVAANSQLKSIAGTLAESSRKLEGALEGI